MIEIVPVEIVASILGSAVVVAVVVVEIAPLGLMFAFDYLITFFAANEKVAMIAIVLETCAVVVAAVFQVIERADAVNQSDVAASVSAMAVIPTEAREMQNGNHCMMDGLALIGSQTQNGYAYETLQNENGAGHWGNVGRG